MDDYSGLVHLRMMVRLQEWFHHLTALIKRMEAEKGSERVVAQIGSDSFPAFVNGTQILEFAASRGILLLASPPYTQKLNPVEGLIKILVRMALAMLRHAGAPRTLVEFALVQATMMMNRESSEGGEGAGGSTSPVAGYGATVSLACLEGLGLHSVRPSSPGQREIRPEGGSPCPPGL